MSSYVYKSLKKGPLSEFETLKYQKIACGMIPNDPENGYTALGILFCGERNVELMREYHFKAICVSGGAPLQYLNYACSLAMLGLLADAREQAEIACKKSDDEAFALSALINILFSSREVEEMYRRIAQWEEKTQEVHPFRKDEKFSAMLEMCQDMEEDSENDVAEICLAGARTAFQAWTTPEEDEAWKNL